MPARINPAIDAGHRAKIKTTQIVNRLQGFVLGDLDGTNGKPIEMTKERVSAAIALLRKTLPDLAQVEHSGPGGAAIPFVMMGAQEAPTAADWQAEHAAAEDEA